MPNYTEQQLQQALLHLQDGRTLASVSKDWSIPRSTLQSRLQGNQPRLEAYESYQRLSRVQESRLAEWVLTQKALGVAPTHSQIKELAQRILQARGDSTPLGKRWVTRFIKRSPVLGTKRARVMDHTRVNGATTEVIRGWWPNMAIKAIKAIKLANRWNMDETGVMEGMEMNGLVVGRRNKNAVLKKAPGTRAWISFIECISATGQSTSPLVIFKGQTVQQQWFPQSLKPFDG
jgi:4-hydroxybenzoate polyprenyltransferase